MASKPRYTTKQLYGVNIYSSGTQHSLVLAHHPITTQFYKLTKERLTCNLYAFLKVRENFTATKNKRNCIPYSEFTFHADSANKSAASPNSNKISPVRATSKARGN